MTAAPFDLSVTDHLLSTTRSVRRRLDLDRPVEPEKILECLRLAVQAPTGSNRQGWRWMIITDPAKKAELARLYRETGEGYLRAAAARGGSDPQTRRVHESAVYLAENLERVPVHVIPCIQGRPEPGREAGFFGSILPAAWNFMLALRSRGLGAAWTTLHLAKEAEAADLLGIPADVTQAALLPVAYYKGDDFQPAARPPVEDITYWDTWDTGR